MMLTKLADAHEDAHEKTPSRCQNADADAVYHLQYHAMSASDEPLRACS